VITWRAYGQRDASLDTLLDLDGQVLVLDERGGYWVKFEVKGVIPSKERPDFWAEVDAVLKERGVEL
jgi:hypothetical protein